MFYVGQKVVWVGFDSATWRHKWNRFWHPYNDPEIGQIYTVAKVIPFPDGANLQLVEYESGDLNYWCPGFGAGGFRPVVESKSKARFTKGAPLDSEQWDNRRKGVEPAR